MRGFRLYRLHRAAALPLEHHNDHIFLGKVLSKPFPRLSNLLPLNASSWRSARITAPIVCEIYSPQSWFFRAASRPLSGLWHSAVYSHLRLVTLFALGQLCPQFSHVSNLHCQSSPTCGELRVSDMLLFTRPIRHLVFKSGRQCLRPISERSILTLREVF